MADKIKGITLEIGGHTQGLSKALKQVNSETKRTQEELEKVERLLKLDPKNTELLAQKQELLSKQVGITKDKLEGLKLAKVKIDEDMKNGTEVNEKEYRQLQQEIVQAESDLKKLTKETKNFSVTGEKIKAVGNSISDVGKKISDVGKKGLGISAGIIAAGTAAIKSASDTEESLNKVEVAFKNDADAVKKWSDTTLESYGIARGTALDMASLYGDMGTAMEIPTDKAADMSMNLVGLAGDLASFKNVSLDVAQNALKGIFTGEGESLKTLGVIMQDTTLKEYALANGYEKSYQKMSQAEKVQLRYNYVMEQTKNAQGDFANTSDGTANSTRIMTESLKELSDTFGEKILPIITPIIQKITSIIKHITNLPEPMQKIIVVIGIIAAVIPPLLVLIGTLITSIGTITAVIGGIPLVIAAITVALIALWNHCDGFRNGIIAIFNTVINFVKSNWQQILLFITNPIAGAVALLYNLNPKFKAWVDSLITGIKEKFAKMKEIGKYILEGLWNGINDKVEWLKQKVRGVVDKIKGWFTSKDGFDEHSPSKWSEEVGRFLMEGLANGITEDMSAEAALEKKLSNIKEFISTNIDKIQSDIEQKQSKFAQTLSAGNLYDENTVQIGDASDTFYSLHDFSVDTNRNIHYGEMLKNIESRLYAFSDDIEANSAFMELVRSMGIENGTKFGKAIIGASDKDFESYIEGWKYYNISANIVSKNTYNNEATRLKEEFLGTVENGLSEAENSFAQSGADSAIAFGAGFLDKIRSVMAEIQASIASYNSDFALSGIAKGNVSNNSSTTTNHTNNITINNGSNSSSAYEQRAQINSLFNKMKLQGVN